MALTTVPVSMFTAGQTPSFNGVTFPATQSASTDGNTLDDYEEGTWTPAVTFTGGTTGSPTYTTQLGTYTKVGRLVTIQLTLAFNKNTLSGGYLYQITGLPFASNSSAGSNISFGYWYNPSGTAFINVSHFLSAGTSALGVNRMVAANADAAPISIAVSEIASSLNLVYTVTYQTA